MIKYNKSLFITISVILLISLSFLVVNKTKPSLFNWSDIKEQVGDDNNIDGNFVANEEKVELEHPVETPEKLSFLFFGDIMLDRNVAKILKTKTVSELLQPLKEVEIDYFKNRDIVSANLEGAVTDNGAHYSPVNLYDFAFLSDHVLELKNYNFNYFSLANNHFSDQGSRGVDETRENLKSMNFYFSGAPDAQIDDNSQVDIELRGTKLAFISLSMVYHHFDKEKAIALVNLAKEKNDLVLVNIHWGNEYQHYFNKYQQEVGHYLIEAGADIIIGHHPHVVQGMEIYQGKPIFYSLGNFIFDQYFSVQTQEGLALGIEISSEDIIIDFLPHKSIKSSPQFMTELEKNNFLNEYVKWSELPSEREEAVSSGLLVLKR